MQNKTTLRFHLSPIRMAIIKGNNNNKCWRGCSKTEMQISTISVQSRIEVPQKAKDRTAT
jgi:hypothetical protein